ncbi:MAG: hypothetical protein MZU97_19825 [Bacillus subtilis]|nr:hypothetical protein [Bacillus subtilis]
MRPVYSRNIRIVFPTINPPTPARSRLLLDRYADQGRLDGSDRDALLSAIDCRDEMNVACDLLWVEERLVALAVTTTPRSDFGIVLFRKSRRGVYRQLRRDQPTRVRQKAISRYGVSSRAKKIYGTASFAEGQARESA